MKVARAALHHWEEPVLSGVDGSGTVFFSHCPLGCVYCQNASIAQGGGEVVDVERLASIMLELQSQQALNINLVTATHWAPSVRESISLARERGLRLPIVWNTSSYETVESIQGNRGYVDVYLADYKYASPTLARHLSKAPDYPEVALAALEAMVEATGTPTFDEVRGQVRMTGGVIMRHLLLPGHLDDSKRALQLLWERFGNAMAYSIMSQYTPVLAVRAEEGEASARRCLERFPELGRIVRPDEYEQLLDFADDLGMEDYFWQDGQPAVESFIPAFDGTGVSRCAGDGSA